MLGTINYMSPEQAAGRVVDERSDVFAIGVVLHEMLTGRLPAVGETSATDMPSDIRRVVNRCLDPNPELRYRSGRELRQSLIDCRQRRDTEHVPTRVLIRTGRRS